MRSVSRNISTLIMIAIIRAVVLFFSMIGIVLLPGACRSLNVVS